MHTTERIQFKPLNSKHQKDVEALFCNNSLVMQSTFKGRVFTKEEFVIVVQEDFITSIKENIGFWCLTTKTKDTFIGVSGLLKCNYLGNESYEFGFILTENYWGKGLATEIGKFWLAYAKNEMHLKELIATVSPDNNASRKVLEKLGMEYVHNFTSKDRGERLLFRKKL